MKKENITRIWRLAYISLIDGEETYEYFKDKNGDWFAERIIWRLYWCRKE